MRICYSVKQLGKKRPTIEKAYLEIGSLDESPSLDDLLKAIVRQQVNSYNSKRKETPTLDILSQTLINSKAIEGKVGFGELYNLNTANLNQALENASQSFEDGLFAVFIDDQQIESLKEPIHFNEDSVFSFIRLTFLAGSFW